MNPILKNRLVGAGFLVAVGILVPFALVWWAQASNDLGNGHVRVYKITEQGGVVPFKSDSQNQSGADQASRPGSGTTDAAATSPRGAAASADQPSAASNDETDNAKPVIPARPEWEMGAATEAQPTPEPEPKPEPPAPDPEPQPEPEPEPAPQPATEPEPQPQPDPAAGQAEDGSQDGATAGDAGTREGWVVQIGSFSKAKNAHDLKSWVADEYSVFITTGVVSGTRYHRVRVGPFESEQAAKQAARQLRAAGYATQVQHTQ